MLFLAFFTFFTEFMSVLLFTYVCTFLDSWTDDGQYQCDIGWQNFQAGCYRLNSEKLEWSSAEKTCQKMDAHLISIHTLPELEFINMHMKRGAKTYTHSDTNDTLLNYSGVYVCFFWFVRCRRGVDRHARYHHADEF